MADIRRLRPRAETKIRQQLELTEQLVMQLELPEAVMRPVLEEITRRRAAQVEEWRFVQLDPRRLCEVLARLDAAGRHGALAQRALAFCFQHLDHRSQRINLTRQQMIAELKADPGNLSSALKLLVEVGALERVPGKVVAYDLDCDLGTKLPLEERAALAAAKRAKAPPARPRVVRLREVV